MKALFVVGLSVFGYCAWAVGPSQGQIVSPSTKISRCGAPIKPKDVLVLDLEDFGGDLEAAEAFISRHVRDLLIKSEVPETVRTELRSASKNRMSAMKRAQKVAASRGCNVVLVLSAWAGENEAAYAQSFPTSSGRSQTITIGMHYAYARVLMGTGNH